MRNSTGRRGQARQWQTISSRLRAVFVLATCLLCQACTLAEYTSIFREYNPTGPTSVAVDAKQRLVLANRDRSEASRKRGTDGWTTLCAEPSPDVFAAVASALAGQVNVPQEAMAQLTGSLTESGSNIGVRTQTIQLLRDGMYRLCEAFMNRAMDKSTFGSLQKRYQHTMMGLLAIEQLTGPVTPTPIAVHASTTVDSGALLLEAQANLQTARQVRDAEKEKLAIAEADLVEKREASIVATGLVESTKQEASADPPTKSQEDVAQAEATADTAKGERDKAALAVSNAQKSLEEAGEAVSAMEAKVAVAKQPAVFGRADSSFGSVGSRVHPDAEAVKEVAMTVSEIVDYVVNADYSFETCLEYVIDVERYRHKKKKKIVLGPEDRVAFDLCIKLLQESPKECDAESDNVSTGGATLSMLPMSSTSSTQLQYFHTLHVGPELANLRHKPSTTDGTVLATLRKGATVQDLGKVGRWYRVRVLDGSKSGVEGYMGQSVLAVSETRKEALKH